MAEIDDRETTPNPANYGSLIDFFEEDMRRNQPTAYRSINEFFEEDMRRNSPYKSLIEMLEEDQKKHERR